MGERDYPKGDGDPPLFPDPVRVRKYLKEDANDMVYQPRATGDASKPLMAPPRPWIYNDSEDNSGPVVSSPYMQKDLKARMNEIAPRRDYTKERRT